MLIICIRCIRFFIAVPQCVYQHCMDENTQYYYYWHTQTNVVQWDIPAEYSQYLLQMNEYENELQKYEQWCEERKTKCLPTERPTDRPTKEYVQRKVIEEFDNYLQISDLLLLRVIKLVFSIFPRISLLYR